MSDTDYIIQKNGWYLVSNSTNGQSISDAVGTMVDPGVYYNIDGNIAYYAPQPSSDNENWMSIDIEENMQGTLGYWVLITNYDSSPMYLTQSAPFSLQYNDNDNNNSLFFNTTVLPPSNYNYSNLLFDSKVDTDTDNQDDNIKFLLEKKSISIDNRILYNEPVFLKIYSSNPSSDSKYAYFIDNNGTDDNSDSRPIYFASYSDVKNLDSAVYTFYLKPSLENGEPSKNERRPVLLNDAISIGDDTTYSNTNACGHYGCRVLNYGVRPDYTLTMEHGDDAPKTFDVIEKNAFFSSDSPLELYIIVSSFNEGYNTTMEYVNVDFVNENIIIDGNSSQYYINMQPKNEFVPITLITNSKTTQLYIPVDELNNSNGYTYVYSKDDSVQLYNDNDDVISNAGIQLNFKSSSSYVPPPEPAPEPAPEPSPEPAPDSEWTYVNTSTSTLDNVEWKKLGNNDVNGEPYYKLTYKYDYNNNIENTLIFNDDVYLKIWYIVSGGGGGGGAGYVSGLGKFQGGGGSGGKTITNLFSTIGTNPGYTFKITVGDGGTAGSNGQKSILVLPDESSIKATGGNTGDNANSARGGYGGDSVYPNDLDNNNSNIGRGGGYYYGDNGAGFNGVQSNNVNNIPDNEANYYYGWGGAYGSKGNYVSKYGSYNDNGSKVSTDPTSQEANPQRLVGGGGGKGQNITSSLTLGKSFPGVPGVVIFYYQKQSSPVPLTFMNALEDYNYEIYNKENKQYPTQGTISIQSKSTDTGDNRGNSTQQSKSNKGGAPNNARTSPDNIGAWGGSPDLDPPGYTSMVGPTFSSEQIKDRSFIGIISISPGGGGGGGGGGYKNDNGNEKRGGTGGGAAAGCAIIGYISVKNGVKVNNINVKKISGGGVGGIGGSQKESGKHGFAGFTGGNNNINIQLENPQTTIIIKLTGGEYGKGGKSAGDGGGGGGGGTTPGDCIITINDKTQTLNDYNVFHIETDEYTLYIQKFSGDVGKAGWGSSTGGGNGGVIDSNFYSSLSNYNNIFVNRDGEKISKFINSTMSVSQWNNDTTVMNNVLLGTGGLGSQATQDTNAKNAFSGMGGFLAMYIGDNLTDLFTPQNVNVSKNAELLTNTVIREPEPAPEPIPMQAQAPIKNNGIMVLRNLKRRKTGKRVRKSLINKLFSLPKARNLTGKVKRALKFFD